MLVLPGGVVGPKKPQGIRKNDCLTKNTRQFPANRLEPRALDALS